MPVEICAVAYTDYRTDPRVRREAEALVRRGHGVTVLALRRPGEAPEEILDGVRVVHLPVARHRGDGAGRYLVSYANFFARAAAHLSRRPRAFDVIHAHSIPEAVVFAGTLPRLFGARLLLDVHDLTTELYASRHGRAPLAVRVAEAAALRAADAVVTVHEHYRSMIVERGVPAAKVSVVLNTPDEALFGRPRPPVARQESGLRLVYHGTLLRRYGLEVAVRAVARLRERIDGTSLAVYGDGDFRAALLRLVDELGLAGVVRVSPGPVPLEEIPDLVRQADVGLVPFLDDPSTASILPTKLLEYALLGVPAVVSRNPVVERYFGDDDVCFVPPGDVDDVVAAVERLWKEPERAARMAAGAQRFFERHSWAAEQDRFCDLVEGLVHR